MIGDAIVLVNRTNKILEFTADGRHFSLTPGDNYGFLEGHAKFAMSQNPLMGSEDYHSLDFTSLIGVKGKTPCEPIADADLTAAEDAIERFDAQTLPRQNRVTVKARHPQMKGRPFGGGANANAFAVGE